ncbi:hypothetical protein F5X97DRAFT_76759 [Nemania serpens]|nr:hypothetical protein F5X97DRAFT_76759 [Nemania serpens]
MDDQERLSIVNIGNTHDDNQATKVHRDVTTFGSQLPALTVSQVQVSRASGRSLNNLPLELWLEISRHLEPSSIFRLSQVDHRFFSLFIPFRARHEAQVWENIKVNIYPSMLYLALKKNWPLCEIEKIVGVYAACGNYLLETHRSMDWDPPLHVAAEQNRIDVVDLLLRTGVNINIRYGGHLSGCDNRAHLECHKEGMKTCTNALGIARGVMNFEMAEHLLRRGSEDIGTDHFAIENRDWYQPNLMPWSREWSKLK